MGCSGRFLFPFADVETPRFARLLALLWLSNMCLLNSNPPTRCLCRPPTYLTKSKGKKETTEQKKGGGEDEDFALAAVLFLPQRVVQENRRRRGVWLRDRQLT